MCAKVQLDPFLQPPGLEWKRQGGRWFRPLAMVDGSEGGMRGGQQGLASTYTISER